MRSKIVEGLYLADSGTSEPWIGYRSPSRHYYTILDKRKVSHAFPNLLSPDKTDDSVAFLCSEPRLVLPIQFIKGF